MKKISLFPPHVYKRGDIKSIYINELRDYYIDLTSSEYLTDKMIHFFMNDLNNWKHVVRFHSIDDEFINFEYNEDLIDLKFSKALSSKRILLRKTITEIYEQCMKTRFVYKGEVYYICPMDNSLFNFMLDKNSGDITMIDVDGFDISPERQCLLETLLRVNCYRNGYHRI